MGRLFALILCFLAGVAPAFAGDKPDPLGARLEARYRDVKSWRSSFEQTSFVEMIGQSVTKNGRIAVEKPGKMRIEYATEPRKTYIADGKKLWVYQPDTKTAQEYDDPQKLVSKEALSFLSGLSGLSNLFDFVPGLPLPKEYPQIRDAALKKIDLLPKDPESAVLRLVLGVDAETLTLKEAVLFNASGSVTHYVFSDIAFDASLPAEEFALPQGEKIKITK